MVWLFVALVVLIVIVWALDYLDLFDIADVVGALLRLLVAALALLTAFLVWSARRVMRLSAVSTRDGSPPAGPPRRIETQTRTMARNTQHHEPPG